MADQGLIIDVDYNITKAEVKSNKLNRQLDISKQKAENIKKEIQALNDELERSKVKEQEYTIEAERLRDRLNKYAKGELDLTDAQVKKEAQRYDELVKLIEKEQAHQRSKEKSLATQELSLKKQNAETANIGDQILANGKKQSKFSQAFDKSSKSAERFGKRLKSLIASALFFSVVTKAFTALRNEFGKLITETGTKTAELVSQLNGNLAVIGRTLYESARPAIEWVLQGLVKITNLIAYGIAKMTGKSVEEMKKLTKQTKKAGKEAKGSLAGFDQVNTLSKNETDSSSGGDMRFDALTGEIDSNVALLMTLLSGALLVLGVILAFTGINIPLGIGLILIGALGLATTVVPNWNSMSDTIQNVILSILGIVSVALLVLGVILCFSGHIALGIGFLILGAVGLATAVAVSMNKLPDNIKNVVAIIFAIVGVALLVLGIILLTTGVAFGLGLGLLIAGASMLVGSVVANWNSLSDKTKNIIMTITAIVSAALLVLGVIFLFTGVAFALGITFLALGAAGLVTSAMVSWNSMSDKTKEIIGIITIIVSSALLVLGVILAFTGVALGLGLALMVLGAVGLVAAAKLTWNSMSDKTKSVIGNIMAIGGLLLLIIGILLCVTGVGIPLGIALIMVGAASLVGGVSINWNAITDKVKTIASKIKTAFINCWNGIKDGFKSMVNGIISFANIWIKGLNLILTPIRSIVFGIAKAFGSDIKLSDIKIPTIPKLATGAVLPGGSPMLAWVNDQPKGQTYVEGSVDNIVAAFEKYLSGRSFGTPAQDNRPIVVQIDGREVARANRTGNENLGNQTVFGGFANVY